VTADIVRAAGGEVNVTAFFFQIAGATYIHISDLLVYFESVSLFGAGAKDGRWKSRM
jgi:hypothetical protein